LWITKNKFQKDTILPQKFPIMSFMQQLNTKEKCTLRDLIKEEIKSLDKAEDGYGQYRYDENEYCAFLLKLGRKLKLDIQQKIKAKKVYK
jgi:hypothetical protein